MGLALRKKKVKKDFKRKSSKHHGKKKDKSKKKRKRSDWSWVWPCVKRDALPPAAIAIHVQVRAPHHRWQMRKMKTCQRKSWTRSRWASSLVEIRGTCSPNCGPPFPVWMSQLPNIIIHAHQQCWILPLQGTGYTWGQTSRSLRAAPVQLRARTQRTERHWVKLLMAVDVAL